MSRRKIIDIYGLYDPRKPRIIVYVGKGRFPDPAQNHWKKFLKDGTTENNGIKRWFKELKTKGLEPKWHLLETVPISRWEETECKWIRYWRKKNPDLLNVSAGGNEWPFLASAKWYSHHPKALKARNKAIAAWYKKHPKEAMAKAQKTALWFQHHPEKLKFRQRMSSLAMIKWHRQHPKKSAQILAKARRILPEWQRHQRLHVSRGIKRLSCRFCP